MGYPKERILRAFSEVSKTSHSEDTYSLWLSILCHLREDEVYDLCSESETVREECHTISTPYERNGKTLLYVAG